MFQGNIELNIGMSLIEALVAALVLYLSAGILNNNLREEFRISKRVHRFSSAVSTLIIWGIILSIRLLLESLGNFYILDDYYIFKYLNTDAFLFAIMATIFLPLHNIFLKRIAKFKLHGVERFIQNKTFGGLSIKLIYLAWIVGMIFFLIGLVVPNSVLAMYIGNISYYFAIVGTIPLLLYNIYLKKFEEYRLHDGENITKSDQFRGLYIKFIILAWIVGIIFLSIPLLKIPMENPDIFNLGFLWAIFVISFAMFITIIVNKIRPIETRIPYIVLKQAMYTGGFISFGIWSIQLIIVELYLGRLFSINLYIQDIRMLIPVVIAVYIPVFFITLKKVFEPKATERSELILQKAFDIYEKKQEELRTLGNHIILDVQDLTTYFY